ncbi:PREDICTED: nesprin-2-like, partial [Dipodomys ordii]|uniref:Nesprin-2-like n=1 Tax=Dipodomys ordii TaxID=10020 RepID=A0A1S3GWM8_DIPOR
WSQANSDLADQLQKAESQLQLWKAYHSAHAEATARLAQQEVKFEQLADINTSGNNVAEVLPLALQDVKELQDGVQKTKETFLQNITLLDGLPQPTELGSPQQFTVQRHSLQRADYLEKMLLLKANEFEVHFTLPFRSKALGICILPSITVLNEAMPTYMSLASTTGSGRS